MRWPTFGLVRELHRAKKIVVFRRSMGGDVVAHLGSVVRELEVDALVLEASISSVPEVMRELAP
jgi:hypothetical protein